MATRYLGLDIGTTTITAAVVDVESGRTTAAATVANTAETTSAGDRKLGRSEWDAVRMVDIAMDVTGDAAGGAGTIAGIGVTGQQHGMLIVDGEGRPVGPFVGWQDRRGLEPAGNGPGTWVDRIRAAAVEAGASGCRPTAGYLGSTLYWLAEQRRLPDVPFTASFVPDYAVASLTDEPITTDPTNAAGSGLYDIHERRWHNDLIESLGLSVEQLPHVSASGTRAGGLTPDAAVRTRLASGTPVFVACGDNQASYFGSVANHAGSLLINIGTGGQLSVHVGAAESTESLEARPFLDGRFLLVGAGLVGGRSYIWLRDFFVQIGRALYGAAGDEDLYGMMDELAEAIPPGADGLRCEPLFTGTRREPQRRGLWSGVSKDNFSPGHMVRALLEGVAAQFGDYYQEMERCGAGGRDRLVGAGNGIRKNPLLREILQDTLGMRMSIPVHTEEAAYGAALLAAVGDGYFESFGEAAAIIRYA